jgi:hypothetical protein
MTNVLLVRAYVQQTGRSLEQLREEIRAIDDLDGYLDGGIDTDELRTIMGLRTAASPSVTPGHLCQDCGRQLRAQAASCLYCGWRA